LRLLMPAPIMPVMGWRLPLLSLATNIGAGTPLAV
jgi:hypothetical protein